MAKRDKLWLRCFGMSSSSGSQALDHDSPPSFPSRSRFRTPSHHPAYDYASMLEYSHSSLHRTHEAVDSTRHRCGHPYQHWHKWVASCVMSTSGSLTVPRSATFFFQAYYSWYVYDPWMVSYIWRSFLRRIHNIAPMRQRALFNIIAAAVVIVGHWSSHASVSHSSLHSGGYCNSIGWTGHWSDQGGQWALPFAVRVSWHRLPPQYIFGKTKEERNSAMKLWGGVQMAGSLVGDSIITLSIIAIVSGRRVDASQGWCVEQMSCLPLRSFPTAYAI